MTSTVRKANQIKEKHCVVEKSKDVMTSTVQKAKEVNMKHHVAKKSKGCKDKCNAPGQGY
jgi:hypothetical protein